MIKQQAIDNRLKAKDKSGVAFKIKQNFQIKKDFFFSLFLMYVSNNF